jgi:major vault protein
VGPKNIDLKTNEEITTGPEPQDFIVLKPYTYALIEDPAAMDKDGKPTFDKHGRTQVRYGEREIRTDTQYPEPFPLYPGEKLVRVERLLAIPRDCALRVRALRECKGEDGKQRAAGDEWLIKGPKVYVPRIEEERVEMQQPITLEPNKAIKLRAKFACVDVEKNERQPGEEWLIRKPGMYILGVNEVLIEIVNGLVITDKRALHLTATRTFVDVYGKKHRAGEEWLITKDITSVHICDVHEKVLAEVSITVLRSDEYCYLLNPRKDIVNEMGKKMLYRGPCSFFLQPGEVLEGGIKKNYILADDEALLLSAVEDFTETIEGQEKIRSAGEKWLKHGPCCFVPSVEVMVLEKRQAIPMDTIEGVYVRNINSGIIRAQSGKTYMLQEYEELALKDVTETVEELLQKQGNVVRREKYQLVTLKCPFNAAVQVYDYREKKSRIVIGPELVTLQPDEQYTVTYLSGKTPKKPGRVQTLFVWLGPAFSTDIAEVDTSDHAKLEIMMSFNWRFVRKDDNPGLIFNVRDFIGDMCKTMASKVRSAVACVPFDTFHKQSADLVRKAIFGYDAENDRVNESLYFEANGLEVFGVDIQSIEPKDKKTKQSLDKTVTQAIQITTKIQEQEARRVAEKSEQEEKAKLDRLILENKAVVEETKKHFLQLKAESEGIKSKGQAIAEAKAKATAAEISALAEVTAAELKAQAKRIKEMADIEDQKARSDIELKHQKSLNDARIKKAQESASIESEKFKRIMDCIGQQTIVDIANAGPETQAKMLSSLGLSGYMLMGSDNPINLFTTANGMLDTSSFKPPHS